MVADLNLPQDTPRPPRAIPAEDGTAPGPDIPSRPTGLVNLDEGTPIPGPAGIVNLDEDNRHTRQLAAGVPAGADVPSAPAPSAPAPGATRQVQLRLPAEIERAFLVTDQKRKRDGIGGRLDLVCSSFAQLPRGRDELWRLHPLRDVAGEWLDMRKHPRTGRVNTMVPVVLWDHMGDIIAWAAADGLPRWSRADLAVACLATTIDIANPPTIERRSSRSELDALLERYT
jgi:hypothetical protein